MGCPIFSSDTYILPAELSPECFTPRCSDLAEMACFSCYLEYCESCVFGFRRLSPCYDYFYRNQENFFWGNPNEIIWMQKWEIQLSKSIEYSFLKKQSYVWVVWEKRDPNFKYKEQATLCIRQRRRISGKDQKPISPYELRRLKEVNFLFESENEGGVVNQDGFIQHLIDLENLKNKCLKAGKRRIFDETSVAIY